MRARRYWGRWSRKLAEALPRALRNPLVRSKTHFDASLLDGVDVTVATTEAEYLAAFRVVHDAYVARGWIQPNPERLWVTPHHVLPESSILVLRRHGETQGCVALIEDSSLGLPIDHTFGPETQALRGPGRRLVEIGTLAVSPDLRGVGLALVMVISAWRYARHRLQASDMVIAVSENAASYYDALFDFRAYAPVRNYEGFEEGARALESDPVAALHHDVERAAAFLAHQWREPPAGHLNVKTLVQDAVPAGHERFPSEALGREELIRHKLPRAVFQNLFLRHTALIAKLDRQTKDYLLKWRTIETVEGGGA